MNVSEVASRYAKALYELASENKEHDKVFSDLRAVSDLINKDASITEFVRSPVVPGTQKEQAMKEAMFEKGLNTDVRDFVFLLARKNRLRIFSQIVDAYQARSDETHGVIRGMVRSTTVLSPEERDQVEEIVAKATKKRVILNYQEDPGLIGGLIAKVGSYTFDDTLTSHLRRLKENLKRRTH